MTQFSGLARLLVTRHVREYAVINLTVFAGDPSSTGLPSTWDRKAGFSSAGAAARGRRAEDAAARARSFPAASSWALKQRAVLKYASQVRAIASPPARLLVRTALYELGRGGEYVALAGNAHAEGSNGSHDAVHCEQVDVG